MNVFAGINGKDMKRESISVNHVVVTNSLRRSTDIVNWQANLKASVLLNDLI